MEEMLGLTFEAVGAARRPMKARPLLLMATGLLAVTLGAQQKGPLPPPPPGTVAPTSTPSAPSKENSGVPQRSSHITNEPPAIPAEQIIQKFAAREDEFKKERDNYTYTQTLVVESLDPDGNPNGAFRMTSDILFTPAGKRFEKVLYAPQGTLRGFDMDQQDMDDLQHVQPFVLTTAELPKYDIKYVGREQVDELSTYVFDVTPKKIEKNLRYFQGRIWVDDRDLNIVKSDGKAVPDIRKKNNEHLFPRFETFRENIEGNYWFPTYTRSNDVLHFSSGDVGIRMSVRYANYKRFGATVKIGTAKQVDLEKPEKPEKP
jgi:hypothetical protein